MDGMAEVCGRQLLKYPALQIHSSRKRSPNGQLTETREMWTYFSATQMLCGTITLLDPSLLFYCLAFQFQENLPVIASQLLNDTVLKMIDEQFEVPLPWITFHHGYETEVLIVKMKYCILLTIPLLRSIRR